MLLTTESVATFAEAEQVVQHYERRWLIEEFHKAWMSGCRVEERPLQTLDALERMTAITVHIAVRILQLRTAAISTKRPRCDGPSRHSVGWQDGRTPSVPAASDGPLSGEGGGETSGPSVSLAHGLRGRYGREPVKDQIKRQRGRYQEEGSEDCLALKKSPAYQHRCRVLVQRAIEIDALQSALLLAALRCSAAVRIAAASIARLFGPISAYVAALDGIQLSSGDGRLLELQLLLHDSLLIRPWSPTSGRRGDDGTTRYGSQTLKHFTNS